MNATPAVRHIPLDQLVLSPTNVRKVPPSAAEDAELKASIRAGGLKQNLVVHPLADADDVHAVTAGGRRLKALQELAAEGVIPADHPVPCLVEAPEVALETSLMENTVRAAMHPADEFAAMAALIDAGAPIEAVATRFGVSENHVKQRLRLGKVAPELLDEFRAGNVSLEAMMAFTLGADHAAQLAVWRQVNDHSYINPHAVRRLLTQSAVPADSDLGVFVGIAAYEAAGGTVTRDLFSGDEDGFMDDAALVRRLAIEKLEAKAEELRPQWAWTKAVLDLDYGFRAQYRCIEPQAGDLPADLAEEIERIEQRLAEIAEIPEDEGTDELMTEAAQLEERRDEIAQIEEGLAVYTDEQRAVAGCIVTVGDDGDFQFIEGLIERAARPAHPSNTSAEAGDDNDEAIFDRLGGPARTLTAAMKAHRLQIAKAHLAADFGVAFDLALYSLCADLLHRGYHSRPLDLRAIETRPRSTLNDLAGTPADRLLEAREKALDIGWLSLPPAEGFAALAALPPEAKQRLFAWCVAATLNPQLAVEDRAVPVVETAIGRLAIPFADYWRPTAANYWGRTKKAHGLAIAGTILGPRWVRDHAEDKKAILALALEKAFDPEASTACIGLDRAARDAAAAWLPPGIAAGDVADADGDADTAADFEPEDEPLDGEFGDTGEASADLPAFLVEDEPSHARPNGAAAP
jgi:ParB family transcriptional regulator, chromosome partitioning protein